jgi:hypothetical protein
MITYAESSGSITRVIIATATSSMGDCLNLGNLQTLTWPILMMRTLRVQIGSPWQGVWLSLIPFCSSVRSSLDCQRLVGFLHPFGPVLLFKPFDDEMTPSHLLKMVHEEKID